MRERTEHYIVRYVVFGEDIKVKGELLTVVIHTLLKDEIEMIRNGVCPYCKTKFKKIYNHLRSKTTPCSHSFTYTVSEVIKTYTNLLTNIVRGKDTYTLITPNQKIHFKEKKELINHIRQHPEILNTIKENPNRKTKKEIQHLV